MESNDKYSNLFLQIRAMFPWATDVRVEVDTTHDSDIQQFTKDIIDISNTTICFGDKPEPEVYKSLRTPFGMITLNKKDV